MSTGHCVSMNRRDFLKGLGLGAAAVALAPVVSSVHAAVDKPNIVFIIVDDMGYHDLGCYGSKTIKTPNIDRMAKEGMRFTDAYSGATVCAPARSTLMTGYHLGHTSVRGNSGGIPLLDKDTIVFFCSDNGAAKRFDGIHNSSGKMKGFKRSLYEGGIRTPFIARWPGKIKPASTSDLPCYFPDMMPTFTQLAGVTNLVPEDIDGISILPTLLARGKQKKHEYLYWEFGSSRAVRMGKYKACRKNEKAPVELYDLTKDIEEKNNLAQKHPDLAAKLAQIMQTAHKDPRPQIEPKRPKGKRHR